MKIVSVIHPVRAFVGVVLLMAWMIATNHCALGLMIPTTCAREHCPAHNSSQKSDGSGGVLACCKTIHVASLPAKVAVEAAKLTEELPLFVATVVLAATQVEPTLSSIALDTGPPFAFSFAESVLQRSLFSHAPPLTA